MNIPGRNPPFSDYLVVSKTDLNDGIEEMYAWSPARCSVHSFYKLCSVRLLYKNERLFCTFDLHLNVVMISTIDISTTVLRTDGSSTRVARTDLVY